MVQRGTQGLQGKMSKFKLRRYFFQISLELEQTARWWKPPNIDSELQSAAEGGEKLQTNLEVNFS